jgi:hypothetical protein
VLGGHGAAIEGVEELIDCDAVARGEGIRWLRAWLGESVDRPITHPTIPSAENKHIYGVPTPGVTGMLVSGVGCVNGCRFCATSHNFGKRYVPLLRNGREMFNAACRISDELGGKDFFIMDENFLKDRARGMELIEEMERAGRYFNFAVFSSAEAITAFGMDNLVRLGVFWLWIGVESQREVYAKNVGIDMHALIDGLQARGIATLASAILFLEDHTPANMEDDIDYVISLKPDFTQFMQFTPMPVTALYEDMKSKGQIDFSIPFEEWHGQKRLVWHHPAFTPRQTEVWLQHAFDREFERLGSSPMRMTRTHLRGVETLRAMPDSPALRARLSALEARTRELRILVPTMIQHAANRVELAELAALSTNLERVLGPMPSADRAWSAAARLVAAQYALKVRLFGDRTQPATHRDEYHQGHWHHAAHAIGRFAQLLSGRRLLPA